MLLHSNQEVGCTYFGVLWHSFSAENLLWACTVLYNTLSLALTLYDWSFMWYVWSVTLKSVLPSTSNVLTTVSQKSVYRWSTLQFCQEGAGALSSASALYYERVLISCLQQLDALEANDYTNTTKTPAASISLTAHNTLNDIMSPWAWSSLCWVLHRYKSTQSFLVITFGEV